MNIKPCINPTIGQLTAAFELGLLEPEDQLAYKAHLQSCDFCLQELLKMMPFYMTIKEHREEILQALDSAGMSFDELRDKMLSNVAEKDASGNQRQE